MCYSELANFYPKALKGAFFAEELQNASFFNLMDKEKETLEDHGCPKV